MTPDLLSVLGTRPAAGTVLLQKNNAAGTGEGLATDWLLFRDPIQILTAEHVDDVEPLIAELEAATAAGRWAAGFLSYEAAPALDPALVAHPRGALPLAWWGIYDAPQEISLRPTGSINRANNVSATEEVHWRPAITKSFYRQALASIRKHIAAGDTYQVNYTFPLEAPFSGEPAAFFADLCAAQQAAWCAWVDTGRFAICSASPELFFELSGEDIVARPMKGTARRGRFPSEDEARHRELSSSEKNRAENLMIVDMVRNDLGRIAEPGSVRVDELFTVERYPTVLQLTSTIRARTRASYGDLLRALFPSASITGAPKISTARIIRGLEAGPRGVYTGSLGFFGPERQARLNVAIRTATIDRVTHTASYGTGGGIVWDSDPDAEYQECRTKAFVLRSTPPDHALLETLLWRPQSGYFLLERHLKRLIASARYFSMALDLDTIHDRLSRQTAAAQTPQRVRLVVHRDGRVECSAVPAGDLDGTIWNVVLDDRPVDENDPFLFHKTTHRAVYDAASNRHPHADEVLLWNRQGELTESTRANLVLTINGQRLTPPTDCGLLAGTLRAELLARGELREKVLPVSALGDAEEIWLINSVRGWIGTRLLPGELGDRVRVKLGTSSERVGAE